jgi:hypothetical protein
MYNEGIKVHWEIFENAQASRIRSVLNSNAFLSEQEKKAEALAALIASASIYEQGGQLFLYKIQLTFVKDTGKQWAENNMAEFYKTNSVPSANINFFFKKKKILVYCPLGRGPMMDSTCGVIYSIVRFYVF